MAMEDMREPTFLVLAALADGPRHGYAVIREVTDISGGRVTMRPGTLYGALDRLAGEGLVRVEREEVVNGRLRRYYSLTDDGAGVLTEQTERLRANVAEADRRLRLRVRHATGPATAFARVTRLAPPSVPAIG
ncbi:transcriptional regulator [Parafrankia soli]|uniref:Transcriptional regulator n=2 Tax=Frankiaceae TaxID=74712 RepID=A0A1S1PER1_9ACTN|nr:MULTISPECIES: PadR family transcriptional regulator [Parafrankia]OHV21403.1 transcriptional regulator [Parafrankia soli]TCJ36357.1 PadR family transcriptional regulator [Parafrankia sp. BMG5.11]